jgi:hypothetical protein
MRALKLTLITLFTASTLGAQAYNYPVLQTPRIVDREYNFAAASAGNSGTALIFQWREGLNADWQFSLDGGIASPHGGGDTRLLLGGALAWQWKRANADLPFDVALTGGAGFSTGNNLNVVRIPTGAAVGHTFKLENGNELTPFVHPRLSLDFCSDPVETINPNGSVVHVCPSSSKVDVDVDVGVNYEVTPQVALRVAGLLGGTSYLGSTNAIGFSVAWTPKGLKKF